jgi:hypothetical protein
LQQLKYCSNTWWNNQIKPFQERFGHAITNNNEFCIYKSIIITSIVMDIFTIVDVIMKVQNFNPHGARESKNVITIKYCT